MKIQVRTPPINEYPMPTEILFDIGKRLDSYEDGGTSVNDAIEYGLLFLEDNDIIQYIDPKPLR